ncbi:MAG: STAS domain-containing protein [Solirubrobacteraceae bacterium]
MPPPSPHRPESEAGTWFFCLRHTVHAGAVGIVMVGALDGAAADDARAVIGRARVDAAEVICDLHDVSSIDVGGLQALLDAAASARRHHARVTLVNPSAAVRGLIRRLGLEAALQADAAPPAPAPPRTDRRLVDGRGWLQSALRGGKTPRGTPASTSTPLIVRSSLRAARQDHRR